MMTRPASAVLVAAVLLAGCSDAAGPTSSGAWSQVSAGDQFTCALTTTGEAWCWGAAIFGQLGNNATAPSLVPVKVAGDHIFTSIAVGSDHACAIASNQSTWCWGLNDFSELGTSTGACNPAFAFAHCARVPVQVEQAPLFSSITVSGYASCGVTAGGDAFCWGWSDHGQIGSGSVGGQEDLPKKVDGTLHFANISLDIYHACGVTTANGIACWGSNDHGQLATDGASTIACGSGIGAFACSPAPIASAPGLAVKRVSTGATHTCAITTANEAWCWGSNQYGTIGNDSTQETETPRRVSGSTAFTAVDAGETHTCALTAQGEAWCWGTNSFGQLGVPTVGEACPGFGSAVPCRTVPGPVQSSLAFAQLSAGNGHTCGITTAGELWCWGRGSAGQLGNGVAGSSAVPVRVAGP